MKCVLAQLYCIIPLQASWRSQQGKTCRVVFFLPLCNPMLGAYDCVWSHSLYWVSVTLFLWRNHYLGGGGVCRSCLVKPPLLIIAYVHYAPGKRLISWSAVGHCSFWHCWVIFFIYHFSVSYTFLLYVFLDLMVFGNCISHKVCFYLWEE